ncbi:MAG: class I SAM-dependent methyltransferase [Pseudomonadota bacterium]
MVTDPDDKAKGLHASWEENASNWTRAVRDDLIESRARVTNQAVLEVVGSLTPARILDVGCGEGWLVRQLNLLSGCVAEGFDGSSELISAARAEDSEGRYTALTYEAFAADPDALGWRGDLAVCNFSLLSEELVPLLNAIRHCLQPDGHLVIQTLHSWAAGADLGYADGWKEDDFSKLPASDWTPMSWYFRTLGSWLRDINAAGFQLLDLKEPRHPDTGDPVSMILVCRT